MDRSVAVFTRSHPLRGETRVSLRSSISFIAGDGDISRQFAVNAPAAISNVKYEEKSA